MLVESDFVEPLKCQIHFIKSSWVHFSIEVNLQNDFLPDFLADFAGQEFLKKILLFG